MRHVTARVAVLASGAGTNLQALLDDPVVGTWVTLVISDRSGANALDRARARAVEAVHVDPDGFADRAAFDHALVGTLRDHAIDIVAIAVDMLLAPAAGSRGWVRPPHPERALSPMRSHGASR